MPTTRLRLVVIEAPDREGATGPKIAMLGTELALLLTSHLRAGEPLLTSASVVALLLREEPVTERSVFLSTGQDMIDLDVPASILSLPPRPRREALFEAVVEHLHRVAVARTWDPAVIDAAAEKCRGDGLRMRWYATPVWNRLRSHQARVGFWFDDQGGCRGGIDMLDHLGVVVSTSKSGGGFPTLEGFARAAKTLRWSGSHSASFVPHGDRFGVNLAGVTATVP